MNHSIGRTLITSVGRKHKLIVLIFFVGLGPALRTFMKIQAVIDSVMLQTNLSSKYISYLSNKPTAFDAQSTVLSKSTHGDTFTDQLQLWQDST